MAQWRFAVRLGLRLFALGFKFLAFRFRLLPGWRFVLLALVRLVVGFVRVEFRFILFTRSFVALRILVFGILAFRVLFVRILLVFRLVVLFVGLVELFFGIEFVEFRLRLGDDPAELTRLCRFLSRGAEIGTSKSSWAQANCAAFARADLFAGTAASPPFRRLPCSRARFGRHDRA
jgi:hypothetical protein